MSFALTRWSNGISPWQFNLGGGGAARPLIAHTVFDRPLVSRRRNRLDEAFRARAHRGRIRGHQGRGARQGHLAAQRQRPEIRGADQMACRRRRVGVGDSERGQTGQLHGDAGNRRRTVRIRHLPRRAISRAADEGRAQAAGQAADQGDAGRHRCATELPVGRRRGGCARQVPQPAGGIPAACLPEYDDFRFGGKAPKEGVEAVAPYSYDPEGDSDERRGRRPAPMCRPASPAIRCARAA